MTTNVLGTHTLFTMASFRDRNSSSSCKNIIISAKIFEHQSSTCILWVRYHISIGLRTLLYTHKICHIWMKLWCNLSLNLERPCVYVYGTHRNLYKLFVTIEIGFCFVCYVDSVLGTIYFDEGSEIIMCDNNDNIYMWYGLGHLKELRTSHTLTYKKIEERWFDVATDVN